MTDHHCSGRVDKQQDSSISEKDEFIGFACPARRSSRLAFARFFRSRCRSLAAIFSHKTYTSSTPAARSGSNGSPPTRGPGRERPAEPGMLTRFTFQMRTCVRMGVEEAHAHTCGEDERSEEEEEDADVADEDDAVDVPLGKRAAGCAEEDAER